MRFQSRPLSRALYFYLLIFLSLIAARPVKAADKSRLRVEDYQIDAELLPQNHKLTARAVVKITALEDVSVASFQLNNSLRITKLVDAANKPLNPERNTQDSSVRFALNGGLAKGASTSIAFEYEGTLESPDDSPVQGLKLAYVGPDTTYLLYSGFWFPVSGYGINRFTSTVNVTVPAHMIAIGSGKQSLAATSLKKNAPANSKTYTFTWDKPSFPGTIIAGSFQEYKSDDAGIDLHVFFKPLHEKLAAEYAETAVKAFTYYVTQYGNAPSTTVKIVELPDDTVPSSWAPEMALLSSRSISEKVNYRLVANTLAHQWWGVSVSPASKDDWWINDGFARYSEARYVESAAGEAGLEEMVKDMSVGALAYDTVPLSTTAKLDYFSPEFQSVVTDKGAMILHMLRWLIGEPKYLKTMRDFSLQYAGKSASTDDFRKLAEQNYGEKLTWFFSQWLDSTGAPEFKTKYTVYRLGNNKGFRILRGQGMIQQGDLAGALGEFNKALEVNKNSSLGHYRIAEVFYLQRNYQAAANAYRESLNGDGEPRWTEVWSHLQLGKIFDTTGQRERAVNEYRQALQTNDNTAGALERQPQDIYFLHQPPDIPAHPRPRC